MREKLKVFLETEDVELIVDALYYFRNSRLELEKVLVVDDLIFLLKEEYLK